MVKGLSRSLRRGSTSNQHVQKMTLPIRGLSIEVDGASGVGFGTKIIGDFPEGNILLLGAIAYLQFTGPGAAGLLDTWEGDFAIGSTPTADATLGGTDVDIIPSTPVGPAVAEASPRTRGVSAGALAGVVLDNTDGSLELNLNLIVDDASISANDIAITVEGELYLTYTVMGDD